MQISQHSAQLELLQICVMQQRSVGEPQAKAEQADTKRSVSFSHFRQDSKLSGPPAADLSKLTDLAPGVERLNDECLLDAPTVQIHCCIG